MIKKLFKASNNTYFLERSRYLFLCAVLLLLGNSNQAQAILTYNDGPYIYDNNGSTHMLQVLSGELYDQPLATEPFQVRTHDGKYQFSVRRHKFGIPRAEYKQQGEIFVVTDPHGDFESFFTLLKAHGVINNQFQWTYGANHLVVIGDIFDRGVDVVPLYWLVYKLEQEAQEAGGSLHMLLGNHEEMILCGNLKYAEDKYQELVQKTGRSYESLWNNQTELGRWVQSRNTIEKIGNHLFVHAGLSKTIADENWTISAINDTIRQYIAKSPIERKKSAAATFLFGNSGPLWYRGMVKEDEKYNPLIEKDLNRLLEQFDVEAIYLGHTIFPEVTPLFDGRVFAINVANKSNRTHNRTRGLLIKGNKKYLLYNEPQ